MARFKIPPKIIDYNKHMTKAGEYKNRNVATMMNIQICAHQ